MMCRWQILQFLPGPDDGDNKREVARLGLLGFEPVGILTHCLVLKRSDEWGAEGLTMQQYKQIYSSDPPAILNLPDERTP